ncbi:phage tail assembly chaperone [Pelistega sp. MC2]|uniref:phage tail assembly chaperone n=1 Tax=Pelistega sp. MC2 TaxID=1720297 RepID=UPI0008DA7496|nr:putative phage tail assembly chaperone [Pelistega sp. MC2]
MTETHAIELDNVTYTMTPANAMASWSALKIALGLLSTVDFSSTNVASEDDESLNDEDKAKANQQRLGLTIITSLASNLGHPAVKQMEDIVLRHTSAQIDGGKPYRLSNDLDSHFNKYRSHLITVLITGLKYQFGDFFSGGGGLLSNILPSSMVK